MRIQQFPDSTTADQHLLIKVGNVCGYAMITNMYFFTYGNIYEPPHPRYHLLFATIVNSVFSPDNSVCFLGCKNKKKLQF